MFIFLSLKNGQETIEHSAGFDPALENINNALQEIVHNREDVLSFLIYDVAIDHVDFNPDKTLALIWLSLIDPDSGQVIPAEAGLAIGVKNTENTIENMWKIFLQSDSEWQEILNTVPAELLDPEIKDLYTTNAQKQGSHTSCSEWLPSALGSRRNASSHRQHRACFLPIKPVRKPCLYAFDFADGSNFPIVAAKSGVVKYVVWQYPDGNTKHANFIVLEDSSTTPTTYQVYTHLSQDSIPVELRAAGARVVQGQFIGRVDDTGVSTGSHLHFHVHTNPTSYWGSSVDITFDDVSINGGRPRTCLEAAMYPEYGNKCQSENAFVSGNGDSEPPYWRNQLST